MSDRLITGTTSDVFIPLNSNAIELLKQHPNKIDWISLSSNKNAITLLENNYDKIDWKILSRNPSIFEDERMPI